MLKFVSVIVILTVFGALASAGTEEDLKNLETKALAALEKCQASSGVTDEHLKSMISGETPFKGKTDCFIACFAKEMDMMKANNMFDKEKIYKVLDPLITKYKEEKMDDALFNEAKKVVDMCLATQRGGDDACAAAKNVGECITTNMKKAGLLTKPN